MDQEDDFPAAGKLFAKMKPVKKFFLEDRYIRIPGCPTQVITHGAGDPG